MIAKSNERQQTAGSDGNDLSWHVAILNEFVRTPRLLNQHHDLV
jgi:hypothetical protein